MYLVHCGWRSLTQVLSSQWIAWTSIITQCQLSHCKTSDNNKCFTENSSGTWLICSHKKAKLRKLVLQFTSHWPGWADSLCFRSGQWPGQSSRSGYKSKLWPGSFLLQSSVHSQLIRMEQNSILLLTGQCAVPVIGKIYTLGLPYCCLHARQRWRSLSAPAAHAVFSTHLLCPGGCYEMVHGWSNLRLWNSIFFGNRWSNCCNQLLTDHKFSVWSCRPTDSSKDINIPHGVWVVCSMRPPHSCLCYEARLATSAVCYLIEGPANGRRCHHLYHVMLCVSALLAIVWCPIYLACSRIVSKQLDIK